MTRSIILAGTLLALAGCGNTAALDKLLTKSAADFAQANKIALAATPPDVVGSTCWQYFSTNLTALQAAVANAKANAPVGVASALETASVQSDRVLGLLSPEQRDGFLLGCGPEIVKLRGTADAFAVLVAAVVK